jgi:hypothetical protein
MLPYEGTGRSRRIMLFAWFLGCTDTEYPRKNRENTRRSRLSGKAPVFSSSPSLTSNYIIIPGHAVLHLLVLLIIVTNNPPPRPGLRSSYSLYS